MNPAILAYTQLPGQLPPAIAAQLRAAVPYGRRMRLAQGSAAIASLLGIALARVLLAEVQGQPAASLTLQFPYRKKPFSHSGADFSLSHSGSWLAGIACASARVGLDIEVAVPANSSAGSVTRDLADWTAREATVKACGALLDEVDQVQVEVTHCNFRQAHWCLTRPAGPEELISAIVSDQALTLSVRTLSWESLIIRSDAADTEVACA
jgi:phosphopantetheinyl transferase